MWNRVRFWWQHYRRPAAVEDALDRELQASMAMMIDDAVAAGATPEEARRRATLAMGDTVATRDYVRDVLPGHAWRTLRRDLHFATRFFRRRVLFTVTAVASLALGIGGATAVYSWSNHTLFENPAGVARPQELVALFLADKDPSRYNIVSRPHFLELEATQTAFRDIAGSFRNPVALGTGAGARDVTVEFVTGGFFRTLGLQPLRGRGIESTDDVASGPLNAVISDRLWMDLFQRSPEALGRAVSLNGQRFAVVGIAPPDYAGIEYQAYGRPDIWVAVNAYTPLLKTDRVTRRVPLLLVFGRLRDDVTASMASTLLQGTTSRLTHEPADTYRVSTVRVFPVSRMRVARLGVEQLFEVLGTVAALIVAAGCFNTSNLLISQGIGRQSELGLRLALGATRAQLLRQLLTECAVLGAAAGILGIATAFACSAAFAHFPVVSTLGESLHTPTTIDASALAFAAVVTALCVVLFGLLPALLLSTRSPLTGMAGVTGAWTTARSARSRQLILAVQVALSVLLSVAAGLYATSLWRINAQSIPYPIEHITLARINPAALAPDRRTAFYDALLERLRHQPGVVAASLSANSVMAIGGASTATVPNSPGVRGDFSTAGADYFRTLQIPVVAGREFTDHEQGLVAVVNKTLADRLWPDGSAVGRTAYFPGLPPMGAAHTIIGVVDQPRCQDQLDVAERPCVYWPIHLDRATALMLHIRTAGQATRLAELRQMVADLSADVVVDRLSTMEEHLNGIRTGPRASAAITSAMAVLASVLSAIGCAGLLLSLIAEHRRELAIRSAVGVPPQRLRLRMTMQVLAPYATGIAVGASVAWFVGVRMESQLFKTTAHDPIGFATPIVVLTLVGLGTATWAARRTLRFTAAELLRG